ncbi:N-6 DNA methylase [Vibrio algivorus]|uniref:site-specific DNA-methyltransferase (adenine-specific) n=1 Tax=Vibrio algivorus TaxID=1667024 RepID=A0ABQ6EMT6_9VIBR|nr:N-6 DNA methylase [Vibrio algivorus]GLT13920.1 hypothetical protein GCM10007931_08940 [Vibrio algivorus]
MNYRKELEKEFKSTAPYHHRHKVWDDFITCFAIAIHNASLKDEELENKYLQIINQYEKKDRYQFTKMAGLLTEAFEQNGFGDLLGEIYMALEIGSKNLGQFFTPYSLSKMCAQLTLDKKLIESQRYLTASEPACGSGGMIVALADAMYSEGYNPQQLLLANCVDVDQTAAMMCYIQLSLYGIPARVTIGNTLTMKFSRTILTPMYHLGGWVLKEMAGQKLPATSLINNAKTIIKHCSENNTEICKNEIIQKIEAGNEYQIITIIESVSRLSINDDVYDLIA